MAQITGDTHEWFQDWANDYDATLGKVSRHHDLLDTAVKASGIRQHDRVLDIGCGTGLLSLKFLGAADCRIKAIDSSARMLALFQEKIERYNLADRIQCIQEPAEDMECAPGEFDIIAATVSLHHVKEKGPVIRKIYDSLKEGGRFVLGDIDMDTTGRLDDPGRLKRILDYLARELELAMKEGGVQAFERMYDNGKKHILNDGEYCISFDQWAALCRNAGFPQVDIIPLQEYQWFKVLVAIK